MTRKPGDKGPMGEKAHEDQSSETPAKPAGSKDHGGEEDLDEDLEESFPASDAPSDTRAAPRK